MLHKRQIKPFHRAYRAPEQVASTGIERELLTLSCLTRP